MSLLIIVQARSGGTRLLGKIYMSLGKWDMLTHVLKRAQQVGPTVLAMPTEHEPEWDVLGRFVRVVKEHPEADPIMRVTADCPMWDSGLALGILDRYRQGDAHIVATSPDFDGLDVEVFSRAALLHANLQIPIASMWRREHLAQWMRRYLVCEEVQLLGEGPLRWSVDDEGGLDFVRRVFRACGHCEEGVPHHTNSLTSIGGADRRPVWDLHHLDRGDLVECGAYDILKERIGGPTYVSP